MTDRNVLPNDLDMLGWRVKPRADTPALTRTDLAATIVVVLVSAANLAGLLITVCSTLRS